MKKLYILALYFALLVIAACSDNLFGSSSPDKSDSIKSMRIDAENAFRRGDFKKSAEICDMIIAKDSTISFGYYGKAKASLWQHGANPLSIFSLVRQEPGDSLCPFMGDSEKKVRMRNNYFQAMKNIAPILTELNRRDSLTNLYECYNNPRANKDCDSLKDDTREFGKAFCSGPKNCKDITDGRKESFPLSDREYQRSYFGNILLLSVFSKWFLNLLDTNNDSCLTRNIVPPKDATEWKNWGCKNAYNGPEDNDWSLELKCIKDSTGNISVVIDPRKMLDELDKQLSGYYDKVQACAARGENCESVTVPAEIDNFNGKIDNFNGDFKEVEDVLNSLGLTGSGDPDMEGKNLLDELDKYKAYASFYKMGVHIDLDGDGCIDEELLDGMDNDGDDFINENARLAPIDPENPQYKFSYMNSSMWGTIPTFSIFGNFPESEKYNAPRRLDPPVYVCNDPECKKPRELKPDSLGKVTVIGFTQELYPAGSKYAGKQYWTSRDPDLKLRVAQDTTCEKYNLEARQDSIGGCWPYYDEIKFRRYYCK